MPSPGFLSATESAVTIAFAAVANAYGASLADIFRPAFVTGFSIWFCLIAYGVAFGQSEDAFSAIFLKLGRVFLIGTIAFWGWPSLMEFLNAAKDGFVGATIMSTVLEQKLLDPIADLWSSLYAWAFSCLSEFSFRELGKFLVECLLFVLLFVGFGCLSASVGIFACVAMAMYLIANTVFTILIGVGPFFLLCLAFPFLQRFFESYIGSVMTSIFALMFVVMIVNFVAPLFGLVGISSVIPAVTDSATVSDEIKSLLVLFFSKVATCLLIVYLCYKTFDLAAALGGGLNMGTNMINSMSRLAQGGNRGGHDMGPKANEIKGKEGGLKQLAAGASRAIGRGAVRAGAASARSVGTGAIAAGRYAYNRYAQTRNRMSAR